MKLVTAEDQRTLRDWMRLPWRIYRDDPNWIPHLRQDIEKVFDPKRNKLFKGGAAGAGCCMMTPVRRSAAWPPS
ncbi:MAG: hypothetical protein IPM49_18210 [Flavobacteriales bacterium]|nr:hypothetical protein [Flavobacteriales bacterium]